MEGLQEHDELRSQGSVTYCDADKTTDAPKNAAKARSSSKGKSSKNILMVLVVMVVITWAVAATAYFGVINYKALIDKLKYIDKRRSVAPNLPLKRNIFSLESPSNVAEKNKPVENVEKRDGETEKTQEVVAQEVHDEKPKIKSGESATKKSTTDTNKPEVKDEKPKPQKDKSATKKSATDAPKPKKKAKKKKTTEREDIDAGLFDSDNDQAILKDLATGEAMLRKDKGREAMNFFKKLLATDPHSPRALYGKARAILVMSIQERSNPLTVTGIEALQKVIEEPTCPIPLLKAASLMQIDKYIFLGKMGEGYKAAAQLYKKLPNDVEVLNKFGVCYLYIGKTDRAKPIFEKALKVDPDNGFAQTHYGFSLKVLGNYEEGAEYLEKGINSMEEGTQEGKFYMHLADAWQRMNRTSDANNLHQLGADRGIFRSRYQRSLYNVDRLKSKPFWTPKEAKVTDYVNALEKNWKTIRDEALKLMDVDKGVFLHEEESLKNTGEWKQLTLFARGKEKPDCKRLPKTCALVKTMPNAYGCSRGQIKYSIMAPGTHVWAHTGPTNCRLRMHLGLVIPKTGEGAKLRCTDEYRTWEEGKVMIFDDSFEHEVWQYADSYRLILIVDVWHPDITEKEKRGLTPI